MLYLLIKAALSGLLVAAASEVARRWPGLGGLIVSLPHPAGVESASYSPEFEWL